ncbi:MAG TPA: hypothetical protein VJ246_03800 [Patescibacteria group bacterium]|nr:hypothetical protein [Patescibacteria group bacterium]
MKRLFTSLLVVLVLLLPILSFASPAFAQDTGWSGACIDEKNPTVATLQGIECLVVRVLNIGTTMIGLAAFIMLIAGAFMYLTSGGNPKGTEAGQKTITFAIIGIAVALTGFIVLNFISSFTGVKTIQNFTLDVGNIGK